MKVTGIKFVVQNETIGISTRQECLDMSIKEKINDILNRSKHHRRIWTNGKFNEVFIIFTNECEYIKYYLDIEKNKLNYLLKPRHDYTKIDKIEPLLLDYIGIKFTVEREDGEINTWHDRLNRPIQDIVEETWYDKYWENGKFLEVYIEFKSPGRYTKYYLDIGKCKLDQLLQGRDPVKEELARGTTDLTDEQILQKIKDIHKEIIESASRDIPTYY